jgi:hypothetical protein
VIILCGEGEDAFCSGGDQAVRGEGGYDDGSEAVPRLAVLDLQARGILGLYIILGLYLYIYICIYGGALLWTAGLVWGLGSDCIAWDCVGGLGLLWLRVSRGDGWFKKTKN